MTESSGPAITAVIPAFNEEKTIGRVVEDVKRYVQNVIVVDDGSSDATRDVALSAGATVLRHPKNLGYGSALATGFSHFKNNGAGVMVVLDGDGQHNPSEIPRLVKPLVDGLADIVVGSRFMDGEKKANIPRYRKFGIGIVNRAWNFASGEERTDTQCGFRAYSRDAVQKIDIREVSMSASLEILDQAAANNLRVVEVPVSVKYGGDTSSIEPGRHGMELVNYVLKKLKDEHPLLIFGGGGVLVTLVGLVFGVYSINSYFDSKYLPFGPTIVAGLLIYVGTLMVFGGLILNSIQSLAAKIEKRDSK
jgi:dolichol-phosphate mannosyltransferase